MQRTGNGRWALSILLLTAGAWAGDAQLEMYLPLGRTAYQTNEFIHVAVMRSAAEALPAGELSLTLNGTDGSKLAFTFPLEAAEQASRVEHFQLNGWLLRPGHYTLEAMFQGQAAGAAKAEIDVCSHVRKSSFKLADWGSRAAGPEQAVLGEDSVGFNVVLAAYGGISPDDLIRGGLDYMRCCTMGGAHQMDIRMECDWSDPYVLRAASARVAREAFAARLNPNALGVHFYDEPGLTWWKHPKTGEMTPFNIPAQDRSYKAAFGVDAPQYCDVNPDDPKDFARWLHMNRWKESFMEAAWKHSAFPVTHIRSDFIPCNQSVYGYSAYADGYYFNVVRCLPLMCGHGGYDDYGLLYLNPAVHFEFGRMRDLAKPNWYLPAWYDSTPSNRFRLEQYASFMANVQGMMKPPDHLIHRPSRIPHLADGIVESNKLMARLGTIFTSLPVHRPEVAVLYSMSQLLNSEIHDMKEKDSQNKAAYVGGGHSRDKCWMAYLAGVLSHTPLFPIVEEDIADGTLAAHHKAVLLPGVNYLEPRFVAALEAYAAGGGAVILSDDCQVQIKGAQKLGAPVDASFFETLSKLWTEKKEAEYHRLNTMGGLLNAALPLAKALSAKWQQLGIKPPLECDNPTVMVSRQGVGDIEYLFATNITSDPQGGDRNSIKPATATLSLPADGRPVYDALTGGPVAELKEQGKALAGQFRFGPGQMRVFARTARPIRGVQVLAPVVQRDYTVAKNPCRVDFAVTVAVANGDVLNGAAPLSIRVVDPLGVTRFELFRATEQGVCKLSLPLGVNEAAGQWKIAARELLNNTERAATFQLQAPAQCGAAAGAVQRAVCFGNDRENIFRFFALFKDLTIVKGASEYNNAAAERLAAVLKPWDVRAKIVTAAEANKPRPISEEEAPAWCGLEPARVKTGQSNHPAHVGFDVQGPAVLLGTPEDNPLIKFLLERGFLPYKPDKTRLPGPGRGLLAWQRDGVAYWQESVTLVAHDAAGMNEAVGSLYEAAAGIDPLTPWALPTNAAVTPAAKAPAQLPAAPVAWQAAFPDRAAGLRAQGNGNIAVLTQDGTVAVLDPAGKVVWQKTVEGGENWPHGSSADGNLLAAGACTHLTVFDGVGRQLTDVAMQFDAPTGGKQSSPLTAAAVSPDGKSIAAACANGKLLLLDAQGNAKWTTGGVSAADLAKWEADVKEWDAGAAQREAEMKQFTEAEAKWKEDVKKWEAAPAKERGKKPEQPKRPSHPGRPKKPEPVVYQAAAFSSDGSVLLAITKDQGHLFGVADGKPGAKIGGIAPKFRPVRVGENLLVTDGNERLQVLSPAEGKVLSELRFSQRVQAPGKKPGEMVELKDAAASAAVMKDLIIVGTEFDGTVRALKAVQGKVEEQTAWSYKMPLRLTKRVAAGDGLVAVAYWGGTLRILDAAGAVKFGQMLPQDVAAMAWAGKTLVVGLADGRILALDAK